ncbi:hypothetical protein T459_01744 [Capsicum annuum]|uniref:Zinc finger PMZ-type domain-containing protein n=1 Tax=Capsicum annuum TaxID=4072 RepID=A0A2G3AHY9_CAPAN|nr:hypothetical protein T459_01744 [Capsicum annuum]
MDSVRNVLPKAHHRSCAKHIESNWCKKWTSGEMKKLMWWCAWSTNDEEFKDQLNKLGKLDECVANDLVRISQVAWCRAYFDTQCKNPIVDSNFTESFNSWVLEEKGIPIIKMLEKIRVKVMEILANHEDKVRSCKSNYSSEFMKLYNNYRAIAHCCEAHFNGYYGYEVAEGDDKHIMNLEHNKCAYRMWDLSGIPCPHAIKAYLHKNIKPKTQIHWYYYKETYL